METIIDVVALAAFVGYLVGGFKLSAPGAPSWSLVAVALGTGMIGAGLLAAAQVGWAGLVLPDVIAQIAFQGTAAAGVAAGLTRTDAAGEARREDAADPYVGRP